MRRYRNLSMRLPQALITALECRRTEVNASSMTAVIQLQLETQLAALTDDSGRLFWRRQDRKADRSFFSLRPELVDQVERIAVANGANIGDVALNLLANSLDQVSHQAA